MNYYSFAIDQNTKLTISEELEHNLEITDTDLCVVFGNLLQNAVEGVRELQGGEQYIQIKLE